jgi:NDP-sugar pyrophosphorylase family protein
VQAELREPDPETARTKIFGATAASAARSIFVLDRLPGADDQPLLTSYGDWFKTVIGWMPRALNRSRVGFREVSPGIWCGLRNQIASTAQLRPPCWIGENVRVEEHAVIGPRAVLENRTVVDSAVEIVDSIVGPDTFVGALTKVQNSLAWGNTLINWRTGSCTEVPDAFLLSPLAGASRLSGARWTAGGWASALDAMRTVPRGVFHSVKAKLRIR